MMQSKCLMGFFCPVASFTDTPIKCDLHFSIWRKIRKHNADEDLALTPNHYHIITIYKQNRGWNDTSLTSSVGLVICIKISIP